MPTLQPKEQPKMAPAAAAPPQRPGMLQVPTRPSMLRRKTREAFEAVTSIHRIKAAEQAPAVGVSVLYLGISVVENEGGSLEIGFATHDGTYSVDFGTWSLQEQSEIDKQPGGRAEELARHLVAEIENYRKKHLCKFVGAGLTHKLVRLSPQLPSRLWLDLDIVPLVNRREEPSHYATARNRPTAMTVDEEADHVARKCLSIFGPTQQPRLQIGYRNEVEVDCSGRVELTNKRNYEDSVSKSTWEATMKYADSLAENRTRIAFFNTTPQGGGVALMRHALIRFLSRLNVDARWYVPRPKPEIFRVTKNNHNILQGVAHDDVRLTTEQISHLDEWCQHNADTFWTSADGPLAPRSQGGAHVIVVDDPQMPKLIHIAKQLDPERPVIFRSHIQVRADLADTPGTPTAEVWDWLWEYVKQADVFISHPVREFVPNRVDFTRVGYMPATTDWLDGLNKTMADFDTQYYIREFELERFRINMKQLHYPQRPYIVQIARFDPSKGIPDVLASYAKLRRQFMTRERFPMSEIPQLVIAGHGAIDDPDGTRIYDETITLLNTTYRDILDDAIVMRIGPVDQILNSLMSCAHVALQLSTREGFEVKVSEALHKGIPIIATNAGGIPLQVQHGKSGFLVDPGDSDAVALHLYDLFTDQKLYDDMSEYAASHVSDEVSTVGNALCWLYLSDQLVKGEKLEPNCAWINDLAREHAGCPYEDWETRLPRSHKLKLVERQVAEREQPVEGLVDGPADGSADGPDGAESDQADVPVIKLNGSNAQ